MSGCRYLSEKEIESFKTNLVNQRDRTLFVVGLRTGFRISELLSLKVGHVFKYNEMSPTIRLDKNLSKSKTESTETPIHPEAKEELKKLLGHLKIQFGELSPDLYLFQSKKGINSPITRQHAHTLLKRIVKELKLHGKISTHSMRKSYAYKFYKASGNDLRSTQMALRHSYITNTVKYLEPDKEYVDSIIMKL